MFSNISKVKPGKVLRFHNVQLTPPEVLEQAQILLDPEQAPEAGQSPWLAAAEVELTVTESILSLRAEVFEVPAVFSGRLDAHPSTGPISLKAFLNRNQTEIIFPPGKPCPLEQEAAFEVLHPPEVEPIVSSFLLAEPPVEASENLASMLPPEIRVDGMDYASRYWRLIVLKADRIRLLWRGSRIQEGLVQPLPIQTINQPRLRIRISPWDLIYGALQPAISIKAGDPTLPYGLYPYQVRGVQFLAGNPHALLADDLGSGKTIMALVALKSLIHQGQVHKALIVCSPNDLCEWKRRLDEWAPELVAVFVGGDPQQRQAIWNSRANVTLAAFDILCADSQEGRVHDAFDLVILDGAHHARNPSSDLSNEIRKLNPTYCWALTGVPVQDRLDDLEALFLFVYPGLLGSVYLNLQQAREKVAPFFLRRARADIVAELPLKQSQDLWLVLDASQRQVYNRVEKAAIEEIQSLGEEVIRQDLYTMIQNVKQSCNFIPDSPRSPKVDQLLAQVEEIVAGGQKVVVFTYYAQEGVTRLANLLHPFGVAKIFGGQPEAERRHEIERFRLNQSTRVMVASVRLWEANLDLSVASYVIHFDHGWNPAVMGLAEERIFSQGQLHPIQVISYWLLDTVDERIAAILEAKGVSFPLNISGMTEEAFEDLFRLEDLKAILGMQGVKAPVEAREMESWRSLPVEEILGRLVVMEPERYEALLLIVMGHLGYLHPELQERRAEGYFEVVFRNPADEGSVLAVAQCWRSPENIGLAAVQEFSAAVRENPLIRHALLVTTGDFTPEAGDFCSRNGIGLISGDQLAEIIQEMGQV